MGHSATAIDLIQKGNPASQVSQKAHGGIKFNEDIKNKLAYEWKNIFRGLTQADLEKKGWVNIQVLNKVIH